jgi:hypothetical protein
MIQELHLAGFSPSTEEMTMVRVEIERIGNETLDEAIARKVGYQIDNGLVKLWQDGDTWKATVINRTEGGNKSFASSRKQQVLNQVFGFLNPDYVIPA